ncbi:MAG TPA: hypothetical protein VKP30_22695 [Polyangiaceae bacterium]|nr:hypothetical protein [Polyangiaceae bacterium]
MWTSFGIGAAGLIVGSTTGFMALSKHSSLKDSGCTSDECFDSDLQSPMDSYNKLRPIAAAGFIVGGVGAAAGLTLWLTKPKQRVPNQRKFSDCARPVDGAGQVLGD